MTIQYSYSVVTVAASVVKQLKLENDPILLMKWLKDFLKFYFYVTTSYLIEEGSGNNENVN